MKLTQEDREKISEMVADGQWDLVEKVVAELVSHQLTRLTNVGLSEGPREIFSRKAQYEGAKLVKVGVQDMRNQVRKQK